MITQRPRYLQDSCEWETDIYITKNL